MTSTALLNGLATFFGVANHVIEVTNYKGKDSFGKRLLDNTSTRQYRCYIQPNERTAWNNYAATDGLPYIAYVLSVPLNGTLPVLVRVEDQVTIVQAGNTDLDGQVRRLGTVKTYSDQYGNNFVFTITFE